MGRALLLAALGGLLVAALAWAGWLWVDLGEAEISGHGYVAMTLGIVLSLALGCGLMALVFFSARRGYDERVHSEDDDPWRDAP